MAMQIPKHARAQWKNCPRLKEHDHVLWNKGVHVLSVCNDELSKFPSLSGGLPYQ